MLSITQTGDLRHRKRPRTTLGFPPERGVYSMYRVFRKLDGDELLHVASRDELERAVQLIRELNALWPGRYVIKPSCAVGSVLKQKGSEVWFVTPDRPVFDAIQKMAEKKLGALLVVSNGQVVGIVSERDYARKVVLNGKSSKTTLVNEIMTSPVISVAPDESVDECMRIITRNHIRHLPVMENEKVLGVVSIGDLVKWIVSEQEETIEHLATGKIKSASVLRANAGR